MRLRSFAAGLMASLQPTGIAVAQILSFCAANPGEVSFRDAIPSLVVAVVITFVLWLLAWPLCRGARPGALLTSQIAFCFWAFAPLATLLGGSEGERAGLVAPLLLIAWAVLVEATRIWLRRTRRNLSGLYRVVDLVAGVGVAIPVFTLLMAADPADQAPLGASVRRDDARVEASRAADATGLPDIYLIVLDGYGRDDELAEHFGITPGFGARLEQRGFYVARQSRSNYSSTLHALPSLLNYELIQDLLKGRKATRAELIRRVKNNRFMREMRRLGYRLISYDTGIELSQIRAVDEFIEPPPPLTLFHREFRPSYFERGLLGMTAADPWLRRSSSLSEYSLHRDRILHALEDLPRHARDVEPTFAFVHVLSPHEPFVFGRHGEDVSPRDRAYELSHISRDPDFPEEAGRVGPEYARHYADQAQYVADLVIEAVDAILERSPEPPIILIQGDHGPYGFSPNIRQARAANLNAFHLPGDGAARLYPSISPVNSLRVVLNEYFGAELPLVEDRSFDTDWRAPENIIELE